MNEESLDNSDLLKLHADWIEAYEKFKFYHQKFSRLILSEFMSECSNDFYQYVLPPNTLGYRLKLLSQSIDRQFQDILDPFKLTPLQSGILCCLWQQDGLPTLQISKQLQQLSGNLAVALPLMEKQGYIQRQCDKKDRRIFRVWLTPKGKQLKQVLPVQAKELDRKLFRSLSVDERATFSEIVERLRRDFENREEAPQGK